MHLFVYYTVAEFGKLAAVPAVGGTNQITSDALQLVDVGAVALRALVQIFGCVLVSAVHAAVAVVVHRAVTDIVLVH